MMRTKLFILTILMTTSLSFAQRVVQSYIGGSIGPSIPFSQFADDNYKNAEAGMAQVGPAISLQGVYFFDPFIGIGATIGLGMHPLNTTAYENAVIEFSDDIDDIEITSASPYMHLYAAIGFYFNIPLAKDLHLTPKVMGGLLTSVSPEIYANIYYANGDFVYGVTEVAGAASFLPVFGGALRYKATKRLMLTIDFERFSTLQEFQFEDSSGLTYSYEQKVSFFNIMVGAGIVF